MTADIDKILEMWRQRVAEDPVLTAFHRLIPLETPILWKNEEGFLWRGIVIGGKQQVSRSGPDGWVELPRLNVLLEGAEYITHLPENELEYYIEGQWRKYAEVMRRIIPPVSTEAET